LGQGDLEGAIGGESDQRKMTAKEIGKGEVACVPVGHREMSDWALDCGRGRDGPECVPGGWTGMPGGTQVRSGGRAGGELVMGPLSPCHIETMV